MFSFIKIKNPNFRVFLTVCIIYIIYVCINLIIKLHKNPSGYNNIFETFISNDSYSSERCKEHMRDLEENDLFHKVKNLDIVYMWVDGSDTNWQTIMNSTENSRNRSNNELIYSLRSIAKFMPWHQGRIFIVTPNQIPPKLNIIEGIDNSTQLNIYDSSGNIIGKRVIIIDQKSIIPDEVGDTANSFIIEVFLHQIPTLSEDFIYMNDDYFIGKPLIPEDFFTLNIDGTLRPKFYSNNYQIKGGIQQANEFYEEKKKLWLSATYTTNGTLDNYFTSMNNYSNYTPPKRYYLEHAPYMFNKSWCKEVYETWKTDFENMYEHKKRHWKDIIFVLLYRYYCIEIGKQCDLVHETDHIYLKLITNNNDQNIQFYHKVENECPKFFTLNDEYSKDDVMIEMSIFLEDFFDEPSIYEQIEN